MSYNLKLIGYPIKHSLSPWIHEQFLSGTGLEGTYKLFEISPEDQFEEKMKELKEEGTDGFNVTVPYKEKIISFVDELDKTAQEMQAVNTVVNRDGKWYGYNTDGDGYLRSIKSSYPDFFESPERKKALLIGAGGAARAIYYALVNSGIGEVDLANRTLEKAESIARLGNDKVQTAIYTIDEAQKILGSYDLIIQTTSVGMKPNEDETIVTVNSLKENAIASDIVYQPIKTKFLKQAEAAGARLHYGHTMLLYQAHYAFEIWTGKTADASGMADALQKILEGR